MRKSDVKQLFLAIKMADRLMRLKGSVEWLKWSRGGLCGVVVMAIMGDG